MPTTRPRHTITETPHVQQALDELRAKLGEGERIDFAELIVLGARAMARRLSADEAMGTVACKRLADRIRRRSLAYELDVDAADEVKHLGLIPKYE